MIFWWLLQISLQDTIWNTYNTLSLTFKTIQQGGLFSCSDQSTETERPEQAIEQQIYTGSRGNPYHKCWCSEKFTDS